MKTELVQNTSSDKYNSKRSGMLTEADIPVDRPRTKKEYIRI